MRDTFSIGIDYGTESGRVVLVSLQNGEEMGDHVVPYQNGVIDEKLPGSDVPLGNDWALQDPDDYINVLKKGIPAVLERVGIAPEKIIGIGIDFTSCTMLPTDSDGVPLCYHDDLKENPHSWVKLWKHHAAQDKANQFNEIAARRSESFLPRYGGKISAEWMLPKIWQIYEEANTIFHHTDRFLEAGDWVVSQLTDNLAKSSCAAGYKSLWHKQEGYPGKKFLKELDNGLEDLFDTKLRGDIFPLGTKAGELTAEMAELTGLLPGTAVAVGVVDAHASVPAMGVVEPGKMVMAMGTSICHMILDRKEKHVAGMSGVVEDGIIPGFYGYEAGQNAGGDIFNWFIEHAIPPYVKEEATVSGITVHQLLEDKASSIPSGGTGLLALDWWNGNRSTLSDSDLTGLLLGMTLKTKPEEIYRALLEATAFGTRKIIDAFQQQGVEVNTLYACGGLPNKNRLLMQIYADVTNKEIILADSIHTPAIGAAMFGAVSAGTENGGYNTIVDAAAKMSRVKEETIQPKSENVAIYEKLYKEYVKIYDYFGLRNNVMKNVRMMKS